jgi:Chloramphenicol phosphotransferase-like protein
MSVVMLSGPVGAGKTVVAWELVALSKRPQCYLEGDTFWRVFTTMDEGARRERFRLIMRSMTAAAIPLARGGYEVLLDFSFPLDFLDTARKILKEIPLDFVVLRPSLAECERRAGGGRKERFGITRCIGTFMRCLKGCRGMRFVTMRPTQRHWRGGFARGWTMAASGSRRPAA